MASLPIDSTDPAPLATTSLAVGIHDVSKSFDRTPVLRGVSLQCEPGAMVALLGPSGCGKTTLLRIIAGLETPDSGEVRVGDRLLSGPTVNVSPEDRRIGMVFQDWALFPHLSVAKNVAYGLSRAQRGRARVDEALAMVGLAGLGARMPSTLSGGQQQRVALARAIAPEPAVLLLDEPFSNLDTVLRVQVRAEVHALLVGLGITTIFVTHDQEEAFVLGDDVAVMNGGRIVQQATPAEIYRRPADEWVASFVGEANLLSATAVPGADGVLTATTPLGPIMLDDHAPAGAVTVLVRPEHLRLRSPDAPPDSAAHLDRGEPAGAIGTVALIEYYGHDTVYVVDIAGVSVRVRESSEPVFRRGDAVAVHHRDRRAIAYAASPAST